MPPTNPSSMRQAIRQRQQQTFVGRGVELDTFRQQLTLAADDPRRYFVLNVYGQGGVGKTTLLGAFARLGGGQGAAVALTDDSESDAPAAMARLAGQLADALPGGDPGHAFAERYRTYRQKRAELEADPDAPTGLAGLFGRAAVKVGAKALRNVAPGADLVLGFVEDPLAEQAGQWAEFVRRKLGNRDEAQLVLEPEVVLTPLFVQGVRAVAAARPVALVFDTYERTANFLDGWLRALLDFRHGDLPDNLTLVIAGRQPLDRNAWAALEGVIAPLCLEPFDEAEARDYLSRRGVVNEAVVDVILTLSGRLPLLLMLLANQSPDDPAQVGDTTGTAVERFLKWVDDPARRALALNGALPRWLNRDVAALLGGDDAFDWLVANRLIERKGDGEAWTYHEVVREQMLRYKHAEAPGEWTMLHERLAAYYLTMRDELAANARSGAGNPRWRAVAQEELYHRLCARPDAALVGALNQIAGTLGGEWELAAEWAEILSEAGKDTGHEMVLDWGKRLGEGLKDFGQADPDAALNMATQLITYSGLEAPQRAITLGFRSDIHSRHGNDTAALSDLNRAIALDPHNAHILADRGALFSNLDRYDEALADCNLAVTLAPEDASICSRRGSVYWNMGRYDEALADMDCAVELTAQESWPLMHRGAALLQLQRYDQALVDFDRAIRLDPQKPWPIARRGETYRQMGEYDKALADFDRAFELDPTHDMVILNRGETYRQMGEYDQALVDFDRAIDLEPSDWYIYLRAITRRALDPTSDWQVDLNRAIALVEEEHRADPTDLQNLFNLALYRVAQGDEAAAEALYRQGLAAGPTAPTLRDASRDLDDYMALFPDDDAAARLRALLTAEEP